MTVQSSEITTYECNVVGCDHKLVIAGSTTMAQTEASKAGWTKVSFISSKSTMDLCPEHTADLNEFFFGEQQISEETE